MLEFMPGSKRITAFFGKLKELSPSNRFFYTRSAFTILELMILVAVIGILVRISMHNYTVSASKARQAEAKMALVHIYNFEKSFYSEYAAYIPNFGAFTGGGFMDGIQRNYRLGWSTLYANSITGYNGATTPIFIGATGAASNPLCVVATEVAALPSAAVAPFDVNDPQTFIVGAAGPLRSDSGGCDVWQIDQGKNLRNTQINL